jgi:polyisoprenoid-binding protein YceI
MNRSKCLWTGALSLGLMGMSSVGYAALSTATDPRVSFDASGPAGMKIEGTTADLSVADDGVNVVTTVPLANLTTGITLRDHHMRDKYLEVAKYPVATLTVPRSALKVPQTGEQSAADVAGTVQLHGQTRPVRVHYEAKGDGASLSVRGTFHIKMTDFGITVPDYFGVTVKPDVDVSASFHVAGS